MSGDVLDTVDRALDDWDTSRDAMRWTPDLVPPAGPGGTATPVDRGDYHRRRKARRRRNH